MMSLPVLFTAVFAFLGLIVSLSAGFLVQNRITYILWLGIICMILSGMLGAAVYRILELKVPEFLDLLRGGISGFSGSGAEGSSSQDSEGLSAASEAYEGSSEFDESAKPDVFGDHIIVNKVKIKNEPKLIAQAIQTMLARDS